jgi:hypothetical protein
VGRVSPNFYRAQNREHDMRKFHSIAALCGDGLRPELQALLDRLAIDPHSELFVRPDGMMQAGPDPKSKAAPVESAAFYRSSGNAAAILAGQARIKRKISLKPHRAS